MMGLAMAMQQQKYPEPLPVVLIETLTMVFRVGELFELQWQKRDQIPACKCGPHGDRPIYSTGLLERALDAGFDVWVVMSRTKLESYDAWWAEHLPSDHVIIPPTGEDVSLEQAEFEPWLMLVVALKLPHAFLSNEDKEKLPQSILDRKAELWVRHRFSHAGAILAWLHACGVNMACDLQHPATQRSALSVTK